MTSPRTTRWAFAMTVLLLMGAAAPALAADGEVTFGSQWWDQSVREAKFQEFRDIPNGPVFESFVLQDELGKGRYTIYGVDALQNDQSTTALYRRPKWTASVSYTRMPHNFSYIARTPFTEIAPGVLTLPDTLQRTNQENSAAFNNTMTDLLRNAPRVPLGFRTDLTRARLRARPASGFRLDLRGTRRQREGTKAFGASFGFSTALEVTEPIRQTMAQGEARASFVRNRLALEVAGGVDAFENDVDFLVFDNPRRFTDSPTAGSSRGRIDLYPDNRTLRGSARAGLQLPHHAALTAFAELSEIKQDEPWTRMTINTAILNPDSFAIGTSTNGKAVVFTQDYRLTAAPEKHVAGTLRFRRHQYDNDTPVHVFPGQVAYDQTWQPNAVSTHPIGFTNTTVGADVDIHPVDRLTLQGTAEHIRRERTFREVLEDKEWVLMGGARFHARKGLTLEARYRHGDRELEHFEEEDFQNAAGAFVEQPTLRRFDVADRQEEDIRGSIGWSPLERLDLSATYQYIRDKYEDPELAPLDAPFDPDTSDLQLGVLDHVRRIASANGALRLTDRLSVGGGYGWVQVYSLQRSRESGATLARTDSTTWQARIKEWFAYATTNVGYALVKDKVDLLATYEYNHSPGVYHLTNFRNTAVDLPTTKYKRNALGTEVWVHADAATSIGVRWAWEQFEVTDYANENVPLLFPLTGAANAVFLGDSIQDYRAHILGAFIRRTF